MLFNKLQMEAIKIIILINGKWTSFMSHFTVRADSKQNIFSGAVCEGGALKVTKILLNLKKATNC